MRRLANKEKNGTSIAGREERREGERARESELNTAEEVRRKEARQRSAAGNAADKLKEGNFQTKRTDSRTPAIKMR